MRLIAKALIVAALLIAADQIWFHGRYRNQLLDQANAFGTDFEWQMAHLLRMPKSPNRA
jgi:hypothetical protein